MYLTEKNRFYTKAYMFFSKEIYKWSIYLDKECLYSPNKNQILLPYKKLANAILKEWNAQSNIINLNTMPIMKYTFTSIDIISKYRSKIIRELSNYGYCDLLCYRASFPDSLVQRQENLWDPILIWAKNKLNIDLFVTHNVFPLQQNKDSILSIENYIDSLDEYHLLGLYEFTKITGSIILGIAFMCNAITYIDALNCAQLDNLYTIEKYNKEEILKVSYEDYKKSFMRIIHYLRLLK